MRDLRLSLASWQMLQRLNQDGVAIWYCDTDGRFYFTLDELTVDLVRTSTMDTLTRLGCVRRERSTEPWYSISEKGRTALQKRIAAENMLTFVEGDLSTSRMEESYG